LILAIAILLLTSLLATLPWILPLLILPILILALPTATLLLSALAALLVLLVHDRYLQVE